MKPLRRRRTRPSDGRDRLSIRQLRHEVAEELEFHLLRSAEDLKRSGVAATEATREARRRFGDPDRLLRRCLRARRSPTVRVLHGVVPALLLAGTVVVAAATLATLDVSVLRPAVQRGDDRLVLAWSRYGPDGSLGPVSRADFRDWRSATVGPAGPFESLALYAERPGNLRLESEPARSVRILLASPELLATLGLRLATGAAPAPGSEGTPILTDDLWRELFGTGRVGSVRSSVLLDEVRYPGVGRLAPEARLPFAADVLIPLADVSPEWIERTRGWRVYYAAGRLAPGTSRRAAEARLSRVAGRLGEEHPETNRYFGAALRPYGAAVADLGRASLTALLATVALLVVVLVGSWQYRRTPAHASAPWAEEPELVLLLTPAAVLFLWPAARWLAGHLLWASVLGFRPMYDAALGGRLASWYVALAAVVLILAALPVLTDRIGRSMRALRRRSLRGTASLWRVVRLSIATAACVALVVASVHAFRGLRSLEAADPGVRLADLLVVPLRLSADRYPMGEDRVRYFREAIDRVRSLAPGTGIRGAALAERTALGPGRLSRLTISVDGAPLRSGMIRSVDVNRVGPRYFQVAGIRVRDGRGLRVEDEDGPPVAVIGAAVARRMFPDGALGRTFRLGGLDTAYRIVGVVSDVRHESLRRAAEPVVYLPLTRGVGNAATIVVRHEGGRAEVERLVRRELGALDPGVALDRIVSGDSLMRADVATARIPLLMITIAAGIAVILVLNGLAGIAPSETGMGGIVWLTASLGLAVGLGGLSGSLLARRIAETLDLPTVSATGSLTFSCLAVSLLIVALLGWTSLRVRSGHRPDGRGTVALP